MKKVMLALLAILTTLFSSMVPVMAVESSVNTKPVDGITVTTPKETDEIITTTTKKVETTVPSEEKTSKGTSLVVDDGLKEDLYSGNVLKDSEWDLDSLFDRLIVKLRGLVENVRRLCVPVLILAWMILFFVAVLRIATGERGASARLISGIFWVTFAYIGIVSAEAILYAVVKFVIGG